VLSAVSCKAAIPPVPYSSHLAVSEDSSPGSASLLGILERVVFGVTGEQECGAMGAIFETLTPLLRTAPFLTAEFASNRLNLCIPPAPT
jgi:hypothetical protein